MNPLAFIATLVLTPVTLGWLVQLSVSGSALQALICIAALPCIGLGLQLQRDEAVWVRNPPLPDWLA